MLKKEKTILRFVGMQLVTDLDEMMEVPRIGTSG